MKKKILLFTAVLITLSLTAFNVINQSSKATEQKKDSAVATTKANEPKTNALFTDFIYDVGPRFQPFKKSDVHNAKHIIDFIGEEDTNSIATLKSVEIIVIKDERQTTTKEIGYSKVLTEAQRKLLQSFDYNSHFNIRVEYTKINKETGHLEHKFSSPHITVVTEKLAEYSEGNDALKTYLRENSRDARLEANVDPLKLQPAKLFFIITKKGLIENIKLDRTSKYPLVDKTMINLIKNLPGTWTPAKNEKGENINQEFVVSFGLIGC
ncbi:hypothetical protein [Lacinutrix salivirga]